MNLQAQTDHWRGWIDFLSVSTVSLLIWDGFFHFAVDLSDFNAWFLLLLSLFVPFAALLLMARYFVWHKSGTPKTVTLSVLISFLLVVGIGMLAGRIHTLVYPVHVYGIP